MRRLCLLIATLVIQICSYSSSVDLGTLYIPQTGEIVYSHFGYSVSYPQYYKYQVQGYYSNGYRAAMVKWEYYNNTWNKGEVNYNSFTLPYTGSWGGSPGTNDTILCSFTGTPPTITLNFIFTISGESGFAYNFRGAVSDGISGIQLSGSTNSMPATITGTIKIPFFEIENEFTVSLSENNVGLLIDKIIPKDYSDGQTLSYNLSIGTCEVEITPEVSESIEIPVQPESGISNENLPDEIVPPPVPEISKTSSSYGSNTTSSNDITTAINQSGKSGHVLGALTLGSWSLPDLQSSTNNVISSLKTSIGNVGNLYSYLTKPINDLYLPQVTPTSTFTVGSFLGKSFVLDMYKFQEPIGWFRKFLLYLLYLIFVYQLFKILKYITSGGKS